MKRLDEVSAVLLGTPHDQIRPRRDCGPSELRFTTRPDA